LEPTEYVTVPGPVPEVPAWMVSHAALLSAVHAQPAPVLTVTLLTPPVVQTAWVEGLME
jgi:hypothetical protein